MRPPSAAVITPGPPPAEAEASAAELVEIAPGQFRLEGDLGLAAVAQLVGDGSRLYPAAHPRGRRQRRQGPDADATPAGPTVALDLGGIGRSSSAAVALLLEWTDQVQRNGGRLVLTNWPTPLVRIADFSNVAGLLGLPDETATASPTPAEQP